MDFHPARINLRKAGGVAKTSYVNELADAINQISPGYVTGEHQPANQVWTFSFLAKIVTAGPNAEADLTSEMYWVEPQSIDGGDMTATPAFSDDHSLTPLTIIPAANLYQRTATGASGGHGLPTGTIVRVFAEVDRSLSPKVRYSFHHAPTNVFFAVDLTQTGGTAGSSSAFSTFTYTAYHRGTAIVLGTVLSPGNSRARTFKCAATAGTAGSAFYDDAGNFQLWDCNETVATKVCT